MTHGTHWREGTAGHHVGLGDLRERSGLTNHIHVLQSIAQQAPRRARVSTVMRHTGCRLCGSATGASWWRPRNRMR